MKKKIAILLPDLRGGGTERVAVNLANEFSRRGMSVDLVLLQANGVYLPEVVPAVRVIDLDANRLRNSMVPLVKYLRSEMPDALIANMWPLTGIALIAKFISRVKLKLMVVEHINWTSSLSSYSNMHNRLMKIGMRLLFPKADAVVAVSKGAAVDLAKHCALSSDRVSTIYNPIVGAVVQSNDGQFHLPECWGVGPHKKIIAIGSFKHQKNYPLLLSSLSKLAKTTDAKLLILGEGEGRLALETQIKQLGLVDSVLLPGFSSNPQEFLRHADLFVLSSDFEGFGNVIVEALQAGTPVVSTDCPSGPREILEDGKYGILIPVGDAEKLAAAMLQSLNSTHDKEALKARAQDFTIAKSADQYLQLLFPDGSWKVGHE